MQQYEIVHFFYVPPCGCCDDCWGCRMLAEHCLQWVWYVCVLLSSKNCSGCVCLSQPAVCWLTGHWPVFSDCLLCHGWQSATSGLSAFFKCHSVCVLSYHWHMTWMEFLMVKTVLFTSIHCPQNAFWWLEYCIVFPWPWPRVSGLGLRTCGIDLSLVMSSSLSAYSLHL